MYTSVRMCTHVRMHCRGIPADYVIASMSEPKPISLIASRLQIPSEFLHPYGKYKAKIDLKFVEQPLVGRIGKYVCVSGINPTPAGEGKTTTTIGLSQAFRHLDEVAVCCLRQPSMGPTFGMKGGGAGGGYCQIVPMDEFNLHLTGDTHAVSAANNLMAASLDTRMYHEATQTTEALFKRLVPVDPKSGERQMSAPLKRRWQRLSGNTDMDDNISAEDKERLVRLNVDAANVVIRRVVDISDRMLRGVVIGQGPAEQAHQRSTGFDIAVASEVMAILALSTNLEDLRTRIGRMILAFDIHGAPITAEDLGVAGAASALLKDALMPNLMQTLEGTAALIHAGPFANIAHGNSSIIADQIALRLVGADGYVITESGFGADLGFEKMCNIKCRYSNLTPDLMVLVVTSRALRCHGRAEQEQSPEMELKRGCLNMRVHIHHSLQRGVDVVVAVNLMDDDNQDEDIYIRSEGLAAGALAVVKCSHFNDGGLGAVELAKEVRRSCRTPRTTPGSFLYPLEISLKDKMGLYKHILLVQTSPLQSACVGKCTSPMVSTIPAEPTNSWPN
eukprot:GHVS01038065.1.p1 GENE.GHVS01038065.1~~GHVS01038065.1.p1  ORF type:complete len:561 (-),score=69.00 GHVS01038065.1:448-2130(-)